MIDTKNQSTAITPDGTSTITNPNQGTAIDNNQSNPLSGGTNLITGKN